MPQKLYLRDYDAYDNFEKNSIHQIDFKMIKIILFYVCKKKCGLNYRKIMQKLFVIHFLINP